MHFSSEIATKTVVSTENTTIQERKTDHRSLVKGTIHGAFNEI